MSSSLPSGSSSVPLTAAAAAATAAEEGAKTFLSRSAFFVPSGAAAGGAGPFRPLDWSHFHSKMALIGALGAGCLMGVSGMLLVQRLRQRVAPLTSGVAASSEVTSSDQQQQQMTLMREVRDMVKEMKEEKQRGAAAQGQKPLRSALRTVTFSDVQESFQEKEAIQNNTAADSATDAPDSAKNHNGNGSGRSVAASSSASTDFYSAMSSDDEYYDVEEEEAAAEAEAARLADQAPTPSSESDAILELFRRVDEWTEKGDLDDQKRAWQLLKTKEKELGLNAEYLWRLCKTVYLCAAPLPSGCDDKRQMVDASVEYGERSVRCNELSSEAHKWYAIAVGSRAEHVGIKEKIKDGYKFKRHIDRAAELSPRDHAVQHLQGRFCFEVNELSWLDRKMASAWFAEPPTATLEEARDHFLAAEALKKDGWKENRLFLAKTFLKMKDVQRGREWLLKAGELPEKNPEDATLQTEINALLAQYESSQS